MDESGCANLTYPRGDFIDGDLRGKIVLLPAFSKADGLQFSDSEVAELASLHMAKIDLADEVLVIDVDGYVGEQTSIEIGRAQALGKPVRYLSS